MTSIRAEFLIETVMKAHHVLVTEQDLSPKNPKINDTLSALVGMITKTYTVGEEKQALADPRLQSVRAALLDKLSTAEGEMEKYWADYFLDKDDLSIEDLKEFWYWQNYVDLTSLEVSEFPVSKNDKQHAAFVGAGALPLTAIIYHLQTGNPITCIDNDPEACEKSTRLLDRLRLTEMSVLCADGAAVDYDAFDTVFIASLVTNGKKDATIEKIKSSQTETLIALRSAERLHTLLYEQYEENNPAMDNCYFVGKTRHTPDVINTTLIYKSESKACEGCEKRQQGQCWADLQFNA